MNTEFDNFSLTDFKRHSCPDFIILRKGNDASFYSHSFELKGSRPLTLEEIASLDEEKA